MCLHFLRVNKYRFNVLTDGSRTSEKIVQIVLRLHKSVFDHIVDTLYILLDCPIMYFSVSIDVFLRQEPLTLIEYVFDRTLSLDITWLYTTQKFFGERRSNRSRVLLPGVILV